MAKRMLIDALHAEETRVAIADEIQIYDFDLVSNSKKQLKGNIYLAKVTRVEPSLQAAFVEYGGGKQGFLPFAEIHADYYQIPFSDRQKLLEEAAREIESEEAPSGSAQTPEPISETEGLADTSASTTETDGQADFTRHDDTVYDATPEEQNARPAYLIQGEIDLSDSDEDKLVDLFMPQTSDLEASNERAPLTSPSEDLFEDAAKPAIAEDATIYESIKEDIASQQANEEAASADELSGEDVETVATDTNDANVDDDMRERRRRNIFMRRYKIQEVIRRGQVVLVQVIKEERGNKGVSLTTYLSLAGRYCVLMPNSPKDGGISRKIASVEDRKRLKAISTEFRLAEGMSVIIRTAGMDRTHAEIKRDFDYLVHLWNSIREDTLKSNAPALIYEESDIVKRAIRDQYSNDIDEVIVEGDNAYKSAKDFMKLLMPSHAAKVKKHNSTSPLFYAYGIEDQLLSMHEPIVKMKSGAYLVINPTEALISIDVNSGRATGERNIEETALKTNLEAAAEVARQLRLRDLAGLIVIDFIDMMDSRNRRAVEKMLKDSMKPDRAKIQIGRISPFGLLELSRQRLRPSLAETSMTACSHCGGRGVVRSNESMSIQVIRAIEKEASNGNAGILRVAAPQETSLYLLNFKRDVLSELEKRYDISIQFYINTELAASEFTIDKIRRGQYERSEGSSEQGRRVRRQDRSERQERKRQAVAANSLDETKTTNETLPENEASESSASPDDTAASGRRPRNRRRGRRNGRRGDRFDDSQTENNANAANADSAEFAADGNKDSEDTSTPNDTSSSDALGSEAKLPHERKGRDGRGRRNWRGRRDSEGEPTTSDGAPPAARHGRTPATATGDGKELPSFASDISAPVASPAPPTYKPFNDHKTETASAAPVEQSAPPSPPRRGWWQKMISLDD